MSDDQIPTVIPDQPDALTDGVILARKAAKDMMGEVLSELYGIMRDKTQRNHASRVTAAKAIAQIAGALKDDKTADKEGGDLLKKAVKDELAKLSPEQKRAMTTLRKVV